jgi:anti-sigma B factor antagonist
MDGSWRYPGSLPYEGEIFAIDVRADGAVLVLRGELDMAGAPRLESALEAAVAARHQSITLDLAQLAFIDGSSVGLIARVRRRLHERGAELLLRNPQPQIRRVFELCAMLSDLGAAPDAGAVSTARLVWAKAAAVGP